MNIEHLGELTADPRIEEWLVSSEVEIPCLPGIRLPFVLERFEDDPAPAEFIAAIGKFLGLSVEDRNEATQCVFKNYSEFVDAVGEEDVNVDIGIPSDVWKHIQPSAVYVLRRYSGDKKVYVRITAECDWEQEHGLQIVYREGNQLARVSDQDGHLTYSDAYAIPESNNYIC